jgi:hypothetical protein
MGSLVHDQTGRLRVRFGAQIAPVRFFSGVSAFVSYEYRRVSERLGAIIALKRFFSRVYSSVPDQHRRPGETLAAHFALKTILFAVFGHVSGHPVQAGKRFETNTTLERLVTGVRSLFPRRVRKRFGPFGHTVVRTLVTIQGGLFRERFFTNVAHVRFVSGVQHFVFP